MKLADVGVEGFDGMPGSLKPSRMMTRPASSRTVGTRSPPGASTLVTTSDDSEFVNVVGVAPEAACSCSITRNDDARPVRVAELHEADPNTQAVKKATPAGRAT